MTAVEHLARRAVRELKPYRAGTTIAQARRQYGLEHVIKLSSNENPLGPSPLAMMALRDIDALHVYEDDDRSELREKIAAPYRYARDHVVLGHGSNDIIMTLFATFVDEGDEVVIARPTFSLFPKKTLLMGGRVVAVPLRDGVHDLDAMLAAVTNRTKMVVVVDPNNPTGTSVGPQAFDAFARALPERVLLLVDQAYREFMPPGSLDAMSYVGDRPNTIVTRTLSKVYGLASLRFGYAITSSQIISYVERVRTPFNVSRPSALAASAALDDHAFLAGSIRMNEQGKAFLAPAFARLGLAVYPTAANFHAVEVPVEATRAYEDLLKRGIVVRSGDGLEMPRRLRITIGTPDENAALVDALETLVPQWRNVPAAV